MPNFEYYETLGVEKTATQEDIRKAWKKLAVQYHPDKKQDNKEKEEAAERFKKIREAYETLSDTDKRKIYDDADKDKSKIYDDGAEQSPPKPQTKIYFNQSYYEHPALSPLQALKNYLLSAVDKEWDPKNEPIFVNQENNSVYDQSQQLNDIYNILRFYRPYYSHSQEYYEAIDTIFLAWIRDDPLFSLIKNDVSLDHIGSHLVPSLSNLLCNNVLINTKLSSAKRDALIEKLIQADPELFKHAISPIAETYAFNLIKNNQYNILKLYKPSELWVFENPAFISDMLNLELRKVNPNVEFISHLHSCSPSSLVKFGNSDYAQPLELVLWHVANNGRSNILNSLLGEDCGVNDANRKRFNEVVSLYGGPKELSSYTPAYINFLLETEKFELAKSVIKLDTNVVNSLKILNGTQQASPTPIDKMLSKKPPDYELLELLQSKIDRKQTNANQKTVVDIAIDKNDLRLVGICSKGFFTSTSVSNQKSIIELYRHQGKLNKLGRTVSSSFKDFSTFLEKMKNLDVKFDKEELTEVAGGFQDEFFSDLVSSNSNTTNLDAWHDLHNHLLVLTQGNLERVPINYDIQLKFSASERLQKTAIQIGLDAMFDHIIKFRNFEMLGRFLSNPSGLKQFSSSQMVRIFKLAGDVGWFNFPDEFLISSKLFSNDNIHISSRDLGKILADTTLQTKNFFGPTEKYISLMGLLFKNNYLSSLQFLEEAFNHILQDTKTNTNENVSYFIRAVLKLIPTDSLNNKSKDGTEQVLAMLISHSTSSADVDAVLKFKEKQLKSKFHGLGITTKSWDLLKKLGDERKQTLSSPKTEKRDLAEEKPIPSQNIISSTTIENKTPLEKFNKITSPFERTAFFGKKQPLPSIQTSPANKNTTNTQTKKS